MDAGLFGSGITHVSETVYARSPDVVWRLGPDRVLVRRVGGRGEDAAAELLGAAALVWVVLDEPATTSAMISRVPDEAMEIGVPDLGLLLNRGWLVSSLEGWPPTSR